MDKPEVPLPDLLPVEAGVESMASPGGTYSLGLAGGEYTGPGAALGHEEADFALTIPEDHIGLVAYFHRGSQQTIDDLVHNRRQAVRSIGSLEFMSEERFFLDTGRYRAAALVLYGGGAGVDVRFAYSLVADSAAGKIEVLGWTTDGGRQSALKEAVMRLRLEGGE